MPSTAVHAHPGDDRKALVASLDALSHQLQRGSGERESARVRQLSETLAFLCQVAGDAPGLHAALADCRARTDSYLLAASEAAAVGAPDSVIDGLLQRGRLELADQLAALASSHGARC